MYIFKVEIANCGLVTGTIIIPRSHSPSTTKNLFVTHFTLYNRFSELVYDIWNDMLKNKKIGLLIDINNLDELYHLKIKKSGYEISNMSFLNKFEMIDIDTNKPIINKIKELNNINKFRNDRIELLDNLDEWYNISSKWVNKINK